MFTSQMDQQCQEFLQFQEFKMFQIQQGVRQGQDVNLQPARLPLLQPAQVPILQPDRLPLLQPAQQLLLQPLLHPTHLPLPQHARPPLLQPAHHQVLPPAGEIAGPIMRNVHRKLQLKELKPLLMNLTSWITDHTHTAGAKSVLF